MNISNAFMTLAYLAIMASARLFQLRIRLNTGMVN